MRRTLSVVLIGLGLCLQMVRASAYELSPEQQSDRWRLPREAGKVSTVIVIFQDAVETDQARLNFFQVKVEGYGFGPTICGGFYRAFFDSVASEDRLIFKKGEKQWMDVIREPDGTLKFYPKPAVVFIDQGGSRF